MSISQSVPPSNQDWGNWQGPFATFQKTPLTPGPQFILPSTIIIYPSLPHPPPLPPPFLFLSRFPFLLFSCSVFLSYITGHCHGCYCLNELSLDKDVPDGGKAIRLSNVFYLSLVKEYCTTLFTNVRRGCKACLVWRDCGFLGQGGSQKPSKFKVKSLESLFFVLVFIALVVMKWNISL